MNYWDALAQATSRLQRRELRGAERSYLDARGLRDQSPGRVFLTETLGDAARRLWHGIGRRSESEASRWEHADEEFLTAFARAAEMILHEVDGGMARDLDEAVGLLLSSRLHPVDPGRGAVLLRRLLDDARRRGTLPRFHVLPEVGVLELEDLPGIVSAAADLLDSPVGERAAPAERRAWAEAALAASDDARLGDQERFSGLLGLGRARLMDRGDYALDDVADAYVAHLRTSAAPSVGRDRAQVRAVSLLANIGVLGSAVPRYREALDVMALFEPTDPDTLAEYGHARRLVEQRRLLDRDGVWATLARDGDCWTAVLWLRDRPRDAAVYQSGDPQEPLTAFLAVAGDRILSAEADCPWSRFALGPLQEVLCEPTLDGEGHAAPVVDRPPALVDHPLLGGGFTAGADTAVAAGMAWLRVIERLGRGDVSWRTGLHRLARLGDAAARFVVGFLSPELLPGESWPLVPLGERPAPTLHSAAGGAEAMTSGVIVLEGARAVVASGRPDAVLAGWGGEHDRWRVVLDRPSRLRELTPTLRLRGGGFTLLPADDRVDDPAVQLSALERLVTGESRPEGGDLLAVFHWTRLCETHNGDLGDFSALRPRRGRGTGVWNLYLDWLTNVRGDLRSAGGLWDQELSVRVAASEVVVGSDAQLDGAVGVLARRWGVDTDRPGAWVFCDSAVIHWRLARRDADLPARLHDRLRPLAHGHLSLLTASSFLRGEVLEHIGSWLGVGSPVTCRSFSDAGGPLLELAGTGADPESRVSLATLVEGVIDTVGRVAHRGVEPLLVASRGSRLYGILASYVRGEFADGNLMPLLSDSASFWSRDVDLHDRPLVITSLESLEAADGFEAVSADPRAWLARDLRRCDAAARRRRLCGLELAAWQAADPVSVTVTDPRWWRELLHQPRGGADLMLLNAADALDAATNGTAVLIDLPTKAKDKNGTVRWLTGQGWIEADGLGLPEALPPPVADDPTDGPASPALLVGDAEAAWFSTLRQAQAWREIGTGGEWLLVIAETPMTGMAELAQSTAAPVASVVKDVRGAPCGPVVWVRPAELEDADVRRKLAIAKPTLIWATDLRNWLPSDHGTGDEYAGAVRFLLRDAAAPLRLHASRLPRAWREAWPDLVERAGSRPVPVRGGDVTVSGAGDDMPVPVIRFGRFTVPCPACHTETELRGEADLCASCGLDILRWLSPSRRRRLHADLLERKLRHLAEREAGDIMSPLCLWVPPRELETWTEALDRIGRPWRRAFSRSLDSSRPDGTWWICLLGDQPLVPAECRHAVMAPPQDAEELAGLRRDCGDQLTLWYHPLELALLDARIGGRTQPATRMPLPDGDVLTPPSSLDPTWCWEGILPEEVQDLVAGLPAARVRRLAGTVHWLGAVTRDDAQVEDERGDRSLVVRHSRVESEYRLEHGRRILPVLLSLLLGGEREGVVSRLDLADLTLDVDDPDLAWCDRMLMALSASAPDDDVPGRPRLLYIPTLGLARSSRRDVGRLGTVEAVIASVLAGAERLAAALAEATEGELDDGATVQLTPLETPSRDLLVAGIVLGAWSLHGRALPGELMTATSLGRRGTVRDAGELARRLVDAQEREREHWLTRLGESWRVGFLESWLGANIVAADPVADLSPDGQQERRLLEFLDAGRPGRRILVGPRGSGRCRAVARVLAAMRTRSDITVLVPDLGWGARFHAIWHEVAAGSEPPRLMVAPGTRDLGRRLDPAVLPRGEGADVLVVLGLEQHPAALRYQLAQRQRDGLLVAVLDPNLFEESWEHLLLTQPETDELIGFDRLIETARDLRDERADWLDMLGTRTRLGKTRNRDRGEVTAMPVTNLDNALGVLDDLCAADGLVAPVEVVAPLLSDLDYLGRGAARRGWLPVYRWELDALLLPGAAQFLAAVCDASALQGSEDGSSLAHAAPHVRGVWLRPMLDARSAAEYEAWLADVDPDITLDVFARRLRRAGWAVDVFASAVSAARLESLVAAAPEESLVRYASRPLLEVWRHAMSGWSGMPASRPSGPVLTLSTPDRCGGGGAATLVHLCSGAEGPRYHYRVATRAQRRLIVLHQAGSPLARDAAES